MVVSLGPGKFYGTSLPRPRFYNDVKFNDHRVDPPLPVTDPFMSWAQEAHWSMGGLSFKRLRLQGKIEGNVNKLRSQLEKHEKAQAQAQAQSPPPRARSDLVGSKRAASPSPSPPPAPVATKRRRLMTTIEEEKEKEDQENEELKVSNRRRRIWLVKKLGKEFDRVASENEGSDGSGSKAGFSKGLSDGSGSASGLSKGSGDGSEPDLMASRTRSKRLMKGGEPVMKVVEEVKNKKSDGEKNPNSVSDNRVRTSPRLAKRVAN